MTRLGWHLLIVCASLAQVEWAAAHVVLTSQAAPHECACWNTDACCCKHSTAPRQLAESASCHMPQAAPRHAPTCVLESVPCGSPKAMQMLKSLREPALYETCAARSIIEVPADAGPLQPACRATRIALDPPLIPPEPLRS